MNYFNKEQIEELKEAEQYFNTVVNCQYKLPTPITLTKKVVEMYEEVTGKELSHDYNCPHCVYNIYKVAGELYYESIKNLSESTKEKKIKALAKAREAKANKNK